EMNRRIFVTRKSNEADLALLLRLKQCFGRPARSKNEIGVIMANHLVDLPQIQVIGVQSTKRLFELAHADLLTPSMGTDLRHKKCLLASPFEPFPHHFFAPSLV